MASDASPALRLPGRRSRGIGTLVVVVVAVLILVGLGVWQLRRLSEKEHLLQRIAALQAAPAEPLEAVLRRAPEGIEVEYTRVQADCPTLEQTPTVRLYALREGVIGWRVITTCPIDAPPYRSILVDRGFIPREGDGAAPTRTPAPQRLNGPIVGVLRKGDRPTVFTPKHAASSREWFGRDLPAMAAALGAPRPAPLFLMLERPAPATGGPTPAALPTDIPNNHLSYAITWFGLALALVGVYIAKRRRDRKEA